MKSTLTTDSSSIDEVNACLHPLVGDAVHLDAVLPTLLQACGKHGHEVVTVDRQDIAVSGYLTTFNLTNYGTD